MKNRLLWILVMAAVAVSSGCTPAGEEPVSSSGWVFSPDMIFPADHSLKRPEDGVVLQDGRLLVADQEYGLRLVNDDGSSRPFGKFAEAGYLHDPPAIVGGPNGVTLEPDGTHVLVADVFRGGLYQVDTGTEATVKVYQHEFGINVARKDSLGGTWFTQSAENRPENGVEELFRSVFVAIPDGALFYLPPGQDDQLREAVQLLDQLLFANGIALDEANGHLYLAETLGGRITRFDLDVRAGGISNPVIVLQDMWPDNIELDQHGDLWIADPFRSEILVLDLAAGVARSVFRVSTPDSEALLPRIESLVLARETWIDLISPALWHPAPGMMTGMVLTPGDGPVFVTGGGDALVRLPR